MKNKNIVLVGFMGTGKTRVGKALSKKLNYEFIDTDEIIERKANMKIKNIFKKFGEKYFRDLESEVAKEVSELKNKVISTGGGIVLREENVKFLRKNGIVVLLKAKPEIILKRVGKTTKRPLLSQDPQNAILQIKKLLKYRKPFYENAADIKIDTSNLSVKEVVEKILKKLKNF
jgi:shikimate kinase